MCLIMCQYCRGVFRTQSNIYDGAFFAKIVQAYNHLLFSRKKLWRGPKYVFEFVQSSSKDFDTTSVTSICDHNYEF